jgi:hypothetical protein
MKNLLLLLSFSCASSAWAAAPQIIAMPPAAADASASGMPSVQYPTEAATSDTPAPAPALAPAPVAAQPAPETRIVINQPLAVDREGVTPVVHEHAFQPPAPPVPGLVLPGVRSRQP